MSFSSLEKTIAVLIMAMSLSYDKNTLAREKMYYANNCSVIFLIIKKKLRRRGDDYCAGGWIKERACARVCEVYFLVKTLVAPELMYEKRYAA